MHIAAVSHSILRRSLKSIPRPFALLAAAVLVSFTGPAHAETVGHFDFSGTINSQNFYGTYPAFLTNGGVAVGDTIDVQFDLVKVYSNNGISWPGAAQNIVVTDTTRNFIIAQQTAADFDTYPGFGGYPGEYRWDTGIPGHSPFEMTFWFRTTNPNEVPDDILPSTIDASQFDYLHDFIIYYENGQNPTVLDAELSNTILGTSPVPEPATLSLLTISLGGLLTTRGRNFIARRVTRS